jgi:hypothetical protein
MSEATNIPADASLGGKPIAAMGSFRRNLTITLAIVGSVASLLYLFVMIQYGAITFPYWDHLPTATYVIKYFDGNLTFRDLIETHNESRPFFPRLIFVATAALTDWDLRAEYIYIYATVYGMIATVLFALYRISADWPRPVVLMTALLVCVLGCSPVAAMNHYWSLMLFGTLSCLGAMIAFVAVSLRPHAWSANILAAIAAWIGTYSLSEGLFIFPAILIIHQMIAPKPYLPTRWSVFWLVNLLLCYTLYIRGSTIDASVPPEFFNFVAFIVVYVGNPLGSLLWYPEMDVVWLPETAIINAICGILLLAAGLVAAWRGLHELRERRPETLLFFSFAAYAAACCLVTGWGRAVGEYPIGTANSSRYAIFSVCYLFALIFYFAPKFARGEISFKRWHGAALGIFLAASLVSYVRAVPVYKSAHNDNVWLSNAYNYRAEPTALDTRVFPQPDYIYPRRQAMRRLGIGPYRLMPETLAAIHSGTFAAAVRLTPGTVVKQRFHTVHPLVRSISFPVVNWAEKQSVYQVGWKAVGLKSNSVLGEGTFSSAGLADWQAVSLKLNNPTEEGEIEVTFFVDGAAAVQKPIGLALYKSTIDPESPAAVDGKPREDGSKIGFTVYYDR